MDITSFQMKSGLTEKASSALQAFTSNHGGSTMKENLKSAVLNIMEKEPALGFQGLQTGERHRMISEEGLIMFQMASEWISRQPRLDNIKHNVTSYTYKHLTERDYSIYMSSGMWICAAIHLGLKYRRYRKGEDIVCNLPEPARCVRLSLAEYKEMEARYLQVWPGIEFFGR